VSPAANELSRQPRRRCVSVALAFLIGGAVAPQAHASPTADVHELKWFVHRDMVGGGMNLAFYEAILNEALEEARVATEGNQGPTDDLCCSKFVKKKHSSGDRLERFGSSGDGLDVVDAGDYAAIQALGGGGSRAFLVDSINDCGGFPAVGCADLPACNTTPDDDPDLILIVTMDAYDSGVLGLTIAHERGHNACLFHANVNICDLMRSQVNGGCLSSAECTEYGYARTKTNGTCVCHKNSGAPKVNGVACTDGSISGVCSGGVCGDTPGDASVELFAAGGRGAASGATVDDPLLVSAVPGGWEDLGGFGSVIKGLAHDDATGRLYGIEDGSGDDLLSLIDPGTGFVNYTIGAIGGHADVISLAFDPGPSASPVDDRLLALPSSGGFETLIEIDPFTASPTTLGPLNSGVTGGFQGLAYDSTHARLYASGFAGGSLWEIDESSCGDPYFCLISEVLEVDLPRIDSGLAFSATSGNLYLVGRQSGDRIFYDTIDAATFGVAPTMGVQEFTIGGLAAIPLPEPWAPLGSAAGAALLMLLARRRAGPARR
jgi:hypothetical protein